MIPFLCNKHDLVQLLARLQQGELGCPGEEEECCLSHGATQRCWDVLRVR